MKSPGIPGPFYFYSTLQIYLLCVQVFKTIIAFYLHVFGLTFWADYFINQILAPIEWYGEVAFEYSVNKYRRFFQILDLSFRRHLGKTIRCHCRLFKSSESKFCTTNCIGIFFQNQKGNLGFVIFILHKITFTYIMAGWNNSRHFRLLFPVFLRHQPP